MDTADRRRNLADFASFLREAGAVVPDVVQEAATPRPGYAEPPPIQPLIPNPKPKWRGFSGVKGPGVQPLGAPQQRRFPVIDPPPGYGQ
jgi:hypothetical protein